ncbi:N-acetyltransferase [Bifidobacterium longum]|nr:N-acetyltransferase [Bifidobacterium longum]
MGFVRTGPGRAHAGGDGPAARERADLEMTDFTPPRRLTAEDDADGFDCGLPVVNDWLRNQLRNAGKQHTAVAYATFCDGAPAGFYTLGAYSIGHAEANGWLRRNSPDPIPAILLGMLGVAMRYQTMHVGAQLLRDAAMRAMGAAEIVGAKALLVEPASDRATRFYEHYGFRHIERSGRMFIPLRPA